MLPDYFLKFNEALSSFQENFQETNGLQNLEIP